MFTQSAERRDPLLTVAGWIEGGSGFTEAVQIVEGDGAVARKAREAAERELSAAIFSGQHAMFPLTVCAPDLAQAMGILIQSSGIGPLRPNTVVVNWLGDSARAISGIDAHNYVKNLSLMFRQGKNLVVLYMDPETWGRLETEPREGRRIDIWWQNDATSRLMVLLAHLMTRHKPWDKATLRVLAPGDTSRLDDEKDKLKATLEEIRIDAEIDIVADTAAETVVQQSGDAAFVFLPMEIKNNRIIDSIGQSFERSLHRLPISAVVMAAEDIDLDAAPEEGLAAQVAQAADDLESAEKKARHAEKTAGEKKAALETLQLKLSALEQKGVSGAVPLASREALKEELEDAESGAEKAYRRAAKAKYKADEAKKTVEAFNPGSQTTPTSTKKT